MIGQRLGQDLDVSVADYTLLLLLLREGTGAEGRGEEKGACGGGGLVVVMVVAVVVAVCIGDSANCGGFAVKRLLAGTRRYCEVCTPELRETAFYYFLFPRPLLLASNAVSSEYATDLQHHHQQSVSGPTMSGRRSTVQ